METRLLWKQGFVFVCSFSENLKPAVACTNYLLGFHVVWLHPNRTTVPCRLSRRHYYDLDFGTHNTRKEARNHA